MQSLTHKERQALGKLLTLIAQGVEYPEAEWQASAHGVDIDLSRLRDLYDSHDTYTHELKKQG
jgi:hypothetical protein